MKNFLFSFFITQLFCSQIFSQGSWTQKANFPGTAREQAFAFSIGTKGYIGTGYDNSFAHYAFDFWEWDQTTNVWTQLSNFSGGIRSGAVGFSIGTKGYAGTGFNGTNLCSDFWEYDPANDSWTQKASLFSAT